MPQFASMTKDELIEALQNCDAPGDTPVVIGYGAGDYWGNILARPLREMDKRFETRFVQWSGYHNQWKQPRRPDEDAVEVLVLGLMQDDQEEPEQGGDDEEE